MVEIARLSRAQAKENPGQAFDTPGDIVAEVVTETIATITALGHLTS